MEGRRTEGGSDEGGTDKQRDKVLEKRVESLNAEQIQKKGLVFHQK